MMNFSILKTILSSDRTNDYSEGKVNCISIQFSYLLLLFLDAIYSESNPVNLGTTSLLSAIILQHLFFSSELYEVIAKPFTFITLIVVTPLTRQHFSNGIYFSCTSVYIVPLLAVLYQQTAFKTITICTIQIFYFLYFSKKDLEPFIINTDQFKLFNMLFTQLTVVLILIIILSFQIQHRQMILLQKYQELKRRSKLLLGSIHDLKNSTNILIGNVDLCSLEPLSSSAHQAIENAKHCSKLLIHLTNNLLDLGKSDFRSLEINRSFLDLRNHFLQNWNTCQTMLKRKNLQGSLYVASCLPTFVEIDGYRVCQVLLNIISNSVKYTEKGSIVISVDWIPNVATINNSHFEPLPYDEDGIFDKLYSTMSVLEDYQLLGTEKYSGSGRASFADDGINKGVLKITIKHTGAGIGKDNIKQLFKLYSQVSDDMSKRQVGSGLGLYISSEIVKCLDGDIRCFSKLGIGTTFITCIPCKCRA